MKEKVISDLREIQKRRTHCQCSREKVVEKIFFDRVIEDLIRTDREDLTCFLSERMDSVQVTNRDMKILKTCYSYAVAVAKRYGT